MVWLFRSGEQAKTKANPHASCFFKITGSKGVAARCAGYVIGKLPTIMKVLIVEDEIFAALHLESVIEGLGCEVIGIAPDKQTALELAEEKPHLAFVDLNLRDGLTGPEIARSLANRFGTKVLILTANPAQAGAAFEGLLGVVDKPWNDTNLEDIVRTAKSTN